MTATFELPIPTENDAPFGAEQIQTLATAMDAALTDVERNPTPIYGFFNIDGPTSHPNNTTTAIRVALNAQRGGFAVVPPAAYGTFSLPQAGWYWISWLARSHVVSGTTTASGYLRSYLQSPFGSNNQWDAIWSANAADQMDASVSGALYCATAGQTAALTIYQNTGAELGYTGWVLLHRLD